MIHPSMWHPVSLDDSEDVDATPPRLNPVSRAGVAFDFASDVAVFGMVLALAGLVAGLCAVVEVVEFLGEQRK